jgi:hypothetical protein
MVDFANALLFGSQFFMNKRENITRFINRVGADLCQPFRGLPILTASVKSALHFCGSAVPYRRHVELAGTTT